MSNPPTFDMDAVHRYFSAECFNKAWDLIDKPQRTPEEDEQMLRLSLASTYHWTQRPDCTAKNMSIGYWQASRIYAILGQAENARRYGELCLQASQSEGVGPFYLAYAYEALARAAMVAGDQPSMEDHLQSARQISERIENEEYKQGLFADLATIK